MDENEIKLELSEINKWYGRGKKAVHALDNVSLVFTAGIYGLTGKNGAGKTTLMNILTGYLTPDSGDIAFAGKKISTRSRSYKALLGYMPQQQSLYETMTCVQFMNYMAAMKGLDRKHRKENVAGLLDKVHLQDKSNVRIAALSGGMKQRLLLAQSLLGEPVILMLDEPTAGVDPEERENLQTLIYENSGGRIVIMSTHILSDIESIAKEEIHMDKGKIEKGAV